MREMEMKTIGKLKSMKSVYKREELTLGEVSITGKSLLAQSLYQQEVCITGKSGSLIQRIIFTNEES